MQRVAGELGGEGRGDQAGSVRASPHPALTLPRPCPPQVLMCGLPFLLLFLGNFFTTLRVVHQKFHSQWHRGKKE